MSTSKLSPIYQGPAAPRTVLTLVPLAPKSRDLEDVLSAQQYAQYLEQGKILKENIAARDNDTSLNRRNTPAVFKL